MKKKKLSFIILFIIVLLATSVYGTSYKLPEPSYDFYVYDEVGIINSDIEDYIIEVNKELYKKTGAQVVVATLNSLEGIDINFYATSLFEKWKVGSKEYDNGMLLLIVPTDEELWIEMGYGLEGPFPDSKIKRIINDYILPYFGDGEYSDGVLAGFNQILIGLEEEYNISLNKSKVVNDPDFNNDNQMSSFPNIFIIIGVIILLFIDFKFFRGMITYSLFRGIGRGGGSGRSGRGGGSSGGGGRSGGGGAGGKW